MARFISYIMRSLGVVLYLSCFDAFAQNLILNPSFEDLAHCPKDYGTFQEDVLFWLCPTDGSTDYFNSCSKQMPAFRNFAGKQEAFEGNGYAGLYAYGPKDYREYISGELKEQLKKGKKYRISVMVSLSDKSAYAVNKLGFLFTNKPIDLRISRNIAHERMFQESLSNYLGVRNHKFLSDKSDWMKLEGEYIADGTERYVTFGNFEQNRKTRMISTGENLKKAAYYYVDMMLLKEESTLFNLDEVYVFEGLNFDTDGFKIKGDLGVQLQPLVQYLKDNPSLNISIYGHTDNEGNKHYNSELSGKRAKSVGLFLVENGLSPLRIAWRGYGDSKPITTNTTEEGKHKNRRVEFIISQKKREYYASGLFEDDDDN